MKLKKLIKLIDPIGDVIIWTQDDDEEPVFKGSILDIPWWMLDRKIGRADNSGEEPMYITTYTNEHNVKHPALVINIIDE